MSIPKPQRAQKQLAKLKLAIQGPSGSGKTWGALSLARNVWPSAKICVVDTENGSASLYADHFEFDTIPLAPPYHSERYIEALKVIADGGYDVAILDSITPQWDGDGGILRRKEELDQRPGSNSYTNWAKFTPEHERFRAALLHSPIHIIATMRSKQDYVLESNDRGKQTPRKVGMAPIQREGFSYDFSLIFDVQMDHRAVVDKNRTGLFEGAIVNLADPETGKQLGGWLASGVEPHPVVPQAALVPVLVPTPRPVPSPPPPVQRTAAEFALEGDMLKCVVLDVRLTVTTKGAKPGKEYCIVKVNGKVGEKDTLTCWHAGLFATLADTKGKRVKLQIKAGDYPAIENVEEVEGVPYANGVPLGMEDGEIPF